MTEDGFDGFDAFESDLRRGLATLAREAVHEHAGAAGSDHLPRVRPLTAPGQPRLGRRALAAAVAVVVIGGSLAIAIATRADRRSTRVETPQPVVSAVPIGPLHARSDQMAVFTGKEVIIWGGRYQPTSNVTPPAARAADPRSPTALGDGAAYDVSTRRWRVLPPAPIAARYNAAVAWTGSEMLVVGGMSDAVPPSAVGVLEQGAAYDPARNRWRRIPAAPVCVDMGTWTRTRLVVAGNCAGTPLELAAFDPVTNAWSRLPSPAAASQIVAAAGTLFAWNGDTHGERFDAAARKWSALPPLAEQPSIGTVAAAFGADLAVIGPKSPTDARVAVDLLAPGATSWRHFDSIQASPALDFRQSTASRADLLVWNQGVGYAWLSGDPPLRPIEISHIAAGPVSLDRVSETLLVIADRRVFVWGGQSIPNGASGMSRPSNDGGILQLP